MALRWEGVRIVACNCRRLLMASSSFQRVIRRANSSSAAAAAAAWEESVEVETDHSLGHRVEQAFKEYRVRKAAPDWLPFLPGSSYWIPPDRELGEKSQQIPEVSLELSEEEILALLAPSGWPDPFFTQNGW